jgi:glycosyltransferase involved in cell wall biosynthesis
MMADVPPDPDSGAAGTEFQTMQALRALGHSVDAVWAEGLPRRIGHGNLHYLLELPGAYRAAMLRRCATADYDVVHVNQPHGFAAAKALHAASGGRRGVFIHRSHGLEMRAQRDLRAWQRLGGRDGRAPWRRVLGGVLVRLLERSSRQIARHADGHIVSARECADYLVGELRVAPERVALIPQAAAAVFHAAPPKPMTPARMRNVLYAGQYAFAKAPMVAAAAMNALAARDPGLRFTWVCAAAHHGAVRGLLSRAAGERLRLLPWMPQGRLAEVYDECGVFLFPSFFEGFGKAFLEAMTRGMCVVAADNGGARDVIASGADGVLVRTGDAVATASACAELLGSPSRAARMSEAAAAKARGYTWERVARETAAFYEGAIARQRGTRA